MVRSTVLLFTIFQVFCCAFSLENINWENITARNIYIEPIIHNGSTPGGRIIGGEEAQPNSFPYQVGLIIDGNGFCGGSLISDQWVLTAAHCTNEAHEIKVVLGAHNLQASEPAREVITSRKFIVHAGYDEFAISNDISLIQLPKAVKLNDIIKTVGLAPSDGETYEGATAVLSGWGRTSDLSSAASPVLRQVNLSIIKNTVCRRDFSIVTNKQVCTGGAGPKGGCNGDSGGPLVVNGVQIGIVSFGSRYCEGGMPTAYTRVSSYRRWITDNTGL